MLHVGARLCPPLGRNVENHRAWVQRGAASDVHRSCFAQRSQALQDLFTGTTKAGAGLRCEAVLASNSPDRVRFVMSQADKKKKKLDIFYQRCSQDGGPAHWLVSVDLSMSPMLKTRPKLLWPTAARTPGMQTFLQRRPSTLNSKLLCC
jgi:hypothetical protein